MSESTNLDHLLDLWESLFAEQPELDIEDFVAAHCAQLSPEGLDLLREKIKAIQAVNSLLVDSRSQTSGSSRLTTAELLKPQQEPVPGYILQARLGSGGFGQVWKAIGPGGFEVALKFVPRGGRAFSAESRALELIRRIKHPHLLKVYGSWIETDWLVIASELADYSLFDRLQDAISTGASGIPPEELLRYMRQAAEATDFLNQVEIPELGVKGVQHRDIKPQNLLLTGEQVKLADLGISRPVSTRTVSHTGQLSIHYAAPEFFDGKTSRHSDQYGLAVTYVQLRTGHLPFRGNELEVFKGHVQGEPQLDGLAPGERLVVQRALAKRPGDRWPSCTAFVEALASPPKLSWWQAVIDSTGVRPLRRWTAGATTAGLLATLLWLSLPSLWPTPRGDGESVDLKARSTAAPPAAAELANRSVYGTSSPQAFRWPRIETSTFSISGEDLSQDFRVLRGLRIWQTGFGREDRLTAVSGIQGIYATPAGPSASLTQGFERTPSLELLAEPGYVIARVEARRAHGGRLGGLRIEFVRVRAGRLVPEDNYQIEYQLLEQVQTTTSSGSGERPAVGYQISRTDHELGDFGLVEGYCEPLAGVERWIDDNADFMPLLSPHFEPCRYLSRNEQSRSLVSETNEADDGLPLLRPGGELADKPDEIDLEQLEAAERKLVNSLGMQLRLVPVGVIPRREQGAGIKTSPVALVDDVLASLYPPAGGEGGTAIVFNRFWFPQPVPIEPAAYLSNRAAFYCGATEVTRGQFREYILARRQASPGKSLGFTGAERLLEFGGIGYSAESGRFLYSPTFNWANPGFSQNDTHPVVGVSWLDAIEFCAWLSAKEGRKYRLPTSTELAYCRELGGAQTGLAQAAKARQFTVGVDEEPVNSLGLRGLGGNVAEWCGELGVSAGERTYLVTNRIFSGGSYARPSQGGSESLRLHAHQHFSGPDLGFRVVLELPDK